MAKNRKPKTETVFCFRFVLLYSQQGVWEGVLWDNVRRTLALAVDLLVSQILVPLHTPKRTQHTTKHKTAQNKPWPPPGFGLCIFLERIGDAPAGYPAPGHKTPAAPQDTSKISRSRSRHGSRPWSRRIRKPCICICICNCNKIPTKYQQKRASHRANTDTPPAGI